jgi:hypothetical protein
LEADQIKDKVADSLSDEVKYWDDSTVDLNGIKFTLQTRPVYSKRIEMQEVESVGLYTKSNYGDFGVINMNSGELIPFSIQMLSEMQSALRNGLKPQFQTGSIVVVVTK